MKEMPPRNKHTTSFQNTWEVYQQRLEPEMDLAEISCNQRHVEAVWLIKGFTTTLFALGVGLSHA